MKLHNYYPKPKYLIIGSFGPLGYYLNSSRFGVSGIHCAMTHQI